MFVKGNRGGIYHVIYWYAKAINKYMKDYDKNKESSYLKYWDVNNLYGWAMSQNLSVNNFKSIKDISQFNVDFMKKYNEESDEGYFIEVNVPYPEKLHELYNGLPFYLKELKLKKSKSLLLIYTIKVNMLFTQEI